MPKGRGANKSRGRRQKDSEQIRERLGRGALKLQTLLDQHNALAMERRKNDPVAEAVKAYYVESEKARKARHKRRAKWAK